MGGFNTQIDDETQNVVIESAIFDSFHIRKTAQRHVLHSEASQRFERGINPDGVEDALNEAVSMIKQLAGGRIAQGIVTASEYHPELPVISITAERTNHVLGTSLKLEEIKSIFDRLEFPSVEHGDTLAVTVPAADGIFILMQTYLRKLLEFMAMITCQSHYPLVARPLVF